MSICDCCNKKLKVAQWRNGRSLKSCPKCSQDNGREHVYYNFPEDFGTTDLRVTTNNPEGAQSYCNACRGRGKVNSVGILCSDT